MPARELPARVLRILVADDEPKIRKLFAKRLRSAGYPVSEAKTGKEVLTLLRAVEFCLLVLDLDMPEVDGFEVLKVVRAEFPHIPVLVVSGHMQGALLEAAECLGALRTLEKPTAAQLLVPTVQLMLGHTPKPEPGLPPPAQ